MKRDSKADILDRKLQDAIKKPDEWTVQQAIFLYLLIESGMNQIEIERLQKISKPK